MLNTILIETSANYFLNFLVGSDNQIDWLGIAKEPH